MVGCAADYPAHPTSMNSPLLEKAKANFDIFSAAGVYLDHFRFR
jgi:hypothetical protein